MNTGKKQGQVGDSALMEIPLEREEGGANQRFENWKRLRAPGWPGFLRSFFLGSRVRS